MRYFDVYWDTIISKVCKKGIQSILAGSLSFMWGSYSPSSCDVLQLLSSLTSLMRVLATTHLLSTSMTTASALESLIEATNKINAETLHEGDAVTGILVWGRPLPQCNPRRDTLGSGTPVPRIKGGEIFEDSWCAVQNIIYCGEGLIFPLSTKHQEWKYAAEVRTVVIRSHANRTNPTSMVCSWACTSEVDARTRAKGAQQSSVLSNSSEVSLWCISKLFEAILAFSCTTRSCFLMLYNYLCDSN